jgi:fructose-1,6-bisphosphatase
MHEVERCNPELQELAQLFSGIQTASKAITNLVKRSQLPSSSVLGLEGAINVQGEDQKVGDWNLVFLIDRHVCMLLQVHRRYAFSR